jgi:hypothetical protein
MIEQPIMVAKCIYNLIWLSHILPMIVHSGSILELYGESCRFCNHTRRTRLLWTTTVGVRDPVTPVIGIDRPCLYMSIFFYADSWNLPADASRA